jgi:hypothetical protein
VLNGSGETGAAAGGGRRLAPASLSLVSELMQHAAGVSQAAGGCQGAAPGVPRALLSCCGGSSLHGPQGSLLAEILQPASLRHRWTSRSFLL